MKLGELRSAIRKREGKVLVRLVLSADGKQADVALEKGSLLDGIGKVFGEERGVETHLTLLSDGRISKE